MSAVGINRCADADYCPTCGQPRDRAPGPVERLGLRLDSRVLSFRERRSHLTPYEAEYLRALIEREKASHEFLMLRIGTEADDQVTRVYAHRLRAKIKYLTGGAVELRSIWGWGYELIAQPLSVAA